MAELVVGERLTVRPATVEDATEIIRLATLMYEAMGVDASDESWQQAGLEAVTNRLGRDAAIYVTDDPSEKGRLAAVGAGTVAHRLPGPTNPDAAVGYIQWVCTDPKWRRRGLARLITASLLAWYESIGVRSVELHATAEGEALYRSLGFDEGTNLALRLRR